MRQQSIKTSDQIAKNQHFTLLELLDRLLDKGAMVKGEVLLSVADIDLVYLNLGLLLSAVKTVKAAGDSEEALPWQPSPTQSQYPQADHKSTLASAASPAGEYTYDPPRDQVKMRQDDFSHELQPETRRRETTPKTTIDPKNVEKGLARLVLTLIDLLRKLMEKQAIRRIDSGQLHAEEIERVGDTFLRLDERMAQLKETFDLTDEDLNLDLGPLGELL